MDKDLAKRLDRVISLQEQILKELQRPAKDEQRRQLEKFAEKHAVADKPKGYAGLESNLP